MKDRLKVADIKAALNKAAQKFVSDKELADFHEDALEFAVKQMHTDGEVTMMFIAHMRRRPGVDETKPDWEHIPVGFVDWPPPNDQKYEAMEGLGMKLATEFPDYMLVCVNQVAEAWVSQYHEEDVNEDKDGFPDHVPLPSQRPDRQEILMVDSCTVDLRQSTTSLPIIRKESGDFATWGAPREELHQPGKSTVERKNYLVLNIFKGSTTVGAEQQKSKLTPKQVAAAERITEAMLNDTNEETTHA